MVEHDRERAEPFLWRVPLTWDFSQTIALQVQLPCHRYAELTRVQYGVSY